jgi:hypothetical protein
MRFWAGSRRPTGRLPLTGLDSSAGGSLATHDQWTWTAEEEGRRELAVLMPETGGRVPVKVPWSPFGTDVFVALLSVRSPSGVGYFFCAEGTPY